MDELKYGKIEKPVFIRSDERGLFVELINIGKWESLITGKMKAGAIIGNHYHKETNVYLYLLEGQAEIITVDVNNNESKECVLKKGQAFVFRPLEAHAIKYLIDSEFIIMKSKRYDERNPDIYEFVVNK